MGAETVPSGSAGYPPTLRAGPRRGTNGADAARARSNNWVEGSNSYREVVATPLPGQIETERNGRDRSRSDCITSLFALYGGVAAPRRLMEGAHLAREAVDEHQPCILGIQIAYVDVVGHRQCDFLAGNAPDNSGWIDTRSTLYFMADQLLRTLSNQRGR